MTSPEPGNWPEWAVCRFNELNNPDAKGFYVGDGDWPFRGFVVRQGENIFAYANICPHRRHPLDFLPDSFLVEDGALIRCASHGALFEPGTGLCVFGPCQGENLMKLACRLDNNGTIHITAPASLRDAGPIIGTDFDNQSSVDSGNS